MNDIQESLDNLLYSVQEYNQDNPASLTRIIDCLESISKETNTLDYLPLNNISLLLQDNILCIYEEHKMLSDSEHTLLKEWPKLLDDYFNNKDIKETVEYIIQNLSDITWPIPIEENDCDVLKELLITHTSNEDDVKEEDANEDGLSKTITHLVTTATKLLGDDSNTLLDFKEKIDNISEVAETSGFLGFHDLCLMALDNISILCEDIENVTDTQMTLIASWISLANKYIENPENQEYTIGLINNLSNIHWPVAITDDDKVILLEILGLQDTLLEEKDKSEKLELNFTQTLTKTKNLILSFDQSKTRIEEIEQTIQHIVKIAARENLLGIQDICLYFQEAMSLLIKEKTTLTHDEIKFLSHFPELIQIYYQAPGASENVSAIIQYLQKPFWINPLSIEDAELLKNILIDFNENTGIHTFHGNLLASAIEENNKTNHFQVTPSDNPEDDAFISSDLIDMLLSEMLSIADEINELIPEKDDVIETKLEKISKYHLRIERFANASQAAELTGLYQANTVFLENINYLVDKKVFSPEHSSILKDWIQTVTDYLMNVGSPQQSNEIIQLLKNIDLPVPINEEQSNVLIELLNNASCVSEDELTEDNIVTEIDHNDLSITVTEEINSDLLDGLLQELPGQMSDLSEAIQLLCSNNPDINALTKAKRVAHTIKGAANTVGIKGIAYLTHKLEDIFSILSQHQKFPSSKLSEMLISATDCLEDMSESLMERKESPDYTYDIAQEILGWLNLLQTKGIDIIDSDDDEIDSELTRSFELTSTLKQEKIEEKVEDKPTEMISVPIDTIDSLLRLVGESMILNLQLKEKINDSLMKTDNLKEQNTTVRELSNELERFIEMSGNALSKQQVVNQSDYFDPLELEEYNELHTASNRIIEAATDSNEINIDIGSELKNINEILYSQTNLQHEIYDTMMRSRMVPISSIVARLERCVRQTCRTTKKKAKLYCTGQDTLIDRSILNRIIDPLMHMLRNSVDHGIELPEERVKQGKSQTGKIILNITRIGTQINIQFSDDGAGLNKEKILQVAEDKGIINSDSDIPEEEIYRLILQPGFTTREKATQTSGRGVGMDVVYSELLSLNGRLNIDSEENKGLNIELSMPVSLMTSHAIFIEHKKQLLAISNYDVERILHPNDIEVIEQNSSQKLIVDGNKIDFYTIEYLLHSSNENTIDKDNIRPALLINYDNSNRVVFVNTIADSKNIVVKNMGEYLKNVQGVIGATIVGDGSVVPVLDMSDLIRTKVFGKTSTTLNLSHTSIIKLAPTVMIIDDSISTRRALSQVMKDAGYEIMTAKDGIEAIGLMEKKQPSIILVDFEMPRMNGIELTSHVRGMSDLKHIPIIMITSRSTDKHKQLAFDMGVNRYTTKPFSEDNLLDDVASLLSEDV